MAGTWPLEGEDGGGDNEGAKFNKGCGPLQYIPHWSFEKSNSPDATIGH